MKSRHMLRHNIEVWMELGLSLLRGWCKDWKYLFKFCLLEYLNWLTAVNYFQSVQIYTSIVPYKLPFWIVQWLERVCILIKVADSSGRRTVCVGWWWDFVFLNVLGSRGSWVVVMAKWLKCQVFYVLSYRFMSFSVEKVTCVCVCESLKWVSGRSSWELKDMEMKSLLIPYLAFPCFKNGITFSIRK